MKKWLRKVASLVRPFRVTDGRRFRLDSIDCGDTPGFESKKRAQDRLERDIKMLGELQEKLYAQDRWALLLIFQAMDAAGKDSTIKHVMSGVNPQGCQVYSFKAPSDEELDHDFMWRTTCRLPERGRIGIFNRSYYEEVLVLRVHPDLLQYQKLPGRVVDKDIWEDRFKDIRNFERYLTRNGVAICKFFLHVSKKEQRRRFLERLENPEKNWKFSANDVKEREFWDDYRTAYEDAIRYTATEDAPWYVVPADNKWFTRVVVAAAVVETLGSLGLSYPEVDKERRKEILAAKRALLRNQGQSRAFSKGGYPTS